MRAQRFPLGVTQGKLMPYAFALGTPRDRQKGIRQLDAREVTRRNLAASRRPAGQVG